MGLYMMIARNETTSIRQPNVLRPPGLIGKKALLRATLTKDRASGYQKIQKPKKKFFSKNFRKHKKTLSSLPDNTGDKKALINNLKIVQLPNA